MLRSGIYNIASVAIRTVLSVITIPFLIRSLGLDDYGLWLFVSSLVGLIGFMELGLSTAAAYFVSHDLAAEDDKLLSASLIALGIIAALLCIIVIIVVWISAGIVLFYFVGLSDDDHIIALRSLQIGAIVVALRILQGPLIGLKQALQQYLLTSLLISIQAVIINTGLIIVAWFGGGIDDLMLWSALSVASMTIIHAIFASWLLRGHRICFIWDQKHIRDVTRYSATTWAASFGGILFSQGDRVIIGTLLGTQILAIYGVIINVANQINTLAAWLIQPLLPSLSANLTNSYQKDTIKENIRLSLQTCTVLIIFLGATLICFAPELLIIIINRQASASEIFALQIAVIIYSIYSINSIGYYTLLGLNRTTIFMLIQILSGLISLALVALGAYFFGLLGAVGGNIGYWGVFLLTTYGMYYLNIRRHEWVSWITLPLLGFFVLIFALLLSSDNIFLRISILLIVTTMILLWFISKNRDIIDILRRSI